VRRDRRVGKECQGKHRDKPRYMGVIRVRNKERIMDKTRKR
jgi:hypothetical protein